jgi:lysozyme
MVEENEMTVICVDLSHYQAGFDMEAFKADGGLGVILKASEGTSIFDSSYTTHRKNALVAGLAVASYHFFRSSDPTQQADWYLECANPTVGERVVCDVEDTTINKGSVQTFFERILAQRPDLQLTVYTGNVGEEAEQKWGKFDWLAANTSLWTCQYASTPSPWASETWPVWSLWQYTDQGKVAGFTGNVDCNSFNGSNDNFLTWMGPCAQPAPEPSLVPTVTISVISDQPVNIQVSCGGEAVFVGEI